MGDSLDMSEDGNHLIIGARGGTNLNAFVYDYNSSTNAWDKIGGSTLVGTSSSNFGISSAISNDGSVIAVGASGDDADGNDSGRVYMYKRSGSTWVLVSTLSNPSYAANEIFGSSVSLSGDGTRLIAGAPYYDPAGGGTGDAGHAGKIYTFEYIGTSWILRQPIDSFAATGLEAAVSDTTGSHMGQYQSLAISRDGSTIIGGEHLADITLVNEGRTRVFHMPSNIKSIWGSNDDVNWTKITTGNETFRGNDRLEFKNLDNPNYYKYHAIVADAFTRLKEVKLYGIRNQGSSTLHDGALTLTKKVTAPQLESTGILNMKGDYTEIRANSNVVTEFSRSKKFMKFPRIPLPYAAMASQGGYENYVINESSAYGNNTSGAGAWIAFATAGHWLSASNSFDGGTDVFNGTNGPWLSIQLPDKIKLEYLEFYSDGGRTSQLITAGSVYASNDGKNWTNVGSLAGLGSYNVTIPARVDFTHKTLYDRYLLHITGNATTYVHMRKLSLFGTPEYDPEAHGVDVVVKSVPNVPNTDWLEVYYDAKNLADGGVTSVNDLKPVGTANNGVANGNLSVSDGAFTFDGSGDYISSTVTTTTGAFIHTFAFWMNIPSSAATNSTLIGFGTQASDEASVIRFDGVDKFRWYFWGNDIKFTTPNVRDKWVHVVATYDGGNESGITVGNVGVSRKIFINTKETTVIENVGSSAGSDALNLLSTSHTFRVGSSLANSEVMTGKIANARLFNRVLTSDEIYQLYAYQKEYFGHGALGMTLKAGRLGIGTSEPRAALDVRGDIHGGCPAYFSGHLTSNYSGIGIVDWDTIHIIKGCIFDTSTGRLTIQLKGIYRVYYTARQLGTDANAIYLRTRVNGVELGAGYGAIYLNSTRDQAGTTVILDLNVNDIVDIYSPGASGAIASNYNAFTCEYLSST